VVAVLVQAKADADKAGASDGATPTCIAAQNGHADALQVALCFAQANADVDKARIHVSVTPSFVAPTRTWTPPAPTAAQRPAPSRRLTTGHADTRCRVLVQAKG
jgi:hypothetical protein